LADQYFDQALAINHNYASALMWKGIGAERRGRLPEALKHYQHAAVLEPVSVVVVVNLAWALQASGALDKAMDLLQRVDAQGRTSAHYQRVISSLLLDRGDFVNAYRNAVRAMESSEGDRLSVEQMALILQLLGETDEAWGLVRSLYRNGNFDSVGTSVVEEILLSSNTELRSNAAQAIDGLFRQEHQLPEIVWRRHTALLGLIDAYAGNCVSAAKRLGSAVQLGTGSIHGTDFDLLFCNTLTLSLRESGASQRSREQRIVCENEIESALSQGWNSHWITYAEAQMALLDGRPEEGIRKLKSLEERGFLRPDMFQNDPSFIPIRQHSEYRHLMQRIRHLLNDARIEIISMKGEG